MILSRRQERIKVMQSLYALKTKEESRFGQEAQNLVESLKDISLLYFTLLSLFKEMRVLLNHINHPLRLNKVLEFIDQDDLINEQLQAVDQTMWIRNMKIVTNLIQKISEKDKYQEPILKSGQNLEEDSKLLVKLYRKIIAMDEHLLACLSGYNISWEDDLPYVNTFMVRSLFSMGIKKPAFMLIKRAQVSDPHTGFALKLFEKTVANYKVLFAHTDGKTPNWDQERMALVDKIIICMGVSEFLYFDEIPTKVTFDEYVSIAKEYSGEKSSIFINGILHVISKSFDACRQIHTLVL